MTDTLAAAATRNQGVAQSTDTYRFKNPATADDAALELGVDPEIPPQFWNDPLRAATISLSDGRLILCVTRRAGDSMPPTWTVSRDGSWTRVLNLPDLEAEVPLAAVQTVLSRLRVGDQKIAAALAALASPSHLG